MEKYECTNKEECINKMITDINNDSRLTDALKIIVNKQDLETERRIGERVRIKYGVNYTLRYSEIDPLSGRYFTKTNTVNLSGKIVTIFNKSDKYNCLVYAGDKWHIGYYDQTYNIDDLTRNYVNREHQKYFFYNSGLIQSRIIKNEDVQKNVIPMKCYLVNIPESVYPIVLPEEAFDLTIGINDMGRYVENPVIKNAFNDIKEVIQNVFTNQTTTDRNFQDYLDNVAIKEYTTKKRLFEMLKLIFGAQQNEPDEYDNDDDNDEHPIVPYALDIVAPVILEGCDVGIRGLRDSMIYLLDRFIDNAPAFRERFVRNWNNMIDRLNELLRRINPPVIPETAEEENQVAIYNQDIPNVTLGQVNLIIREQERRNQSRERTENNTEQEARRRAREEAEEFVRGINEGSTRRDGNGYYQQQLTQQQSERPLYVTLGVDHTATPKEIKTAYHRLALRWHPDKNPNNFGPATARFQQISQAYTVLKDPVKKRLYDYDGTIGGKTIKNRKGRRKGTKYIKTNKRYKKKIPRKTIKKDKKKSLGYRKNKGRKTRRIN